ncbi:hypothetical protein IAI58_19210 (plasmid) [Roseomonas marmotae]|uniref:hypothetical protein n=1 Tax=Roseomonas marmotae TaxID=2768161 RepID=UPI001AD6A368|nr:hypothetical protein [Roseomonas marmotae]QTI81473.1 hypothetical protein IAI58_19210 [Roseomonas marmotae]
MKTFETKMLVAALRAKMRKLGHSGESKRHGAKRELSSAQVDAACALYNAADRLERCGYDRVSVAWVCGSGLGDFFKKAELGDYGSRVVTELLLEEMK